MSASIESFISARRGGTILESMRWGGPRGAPTLIDLCSVSRSKRPTYSPASGATERALPTELGAPAVIRGRVGKRTVGDLPGVFMNDEDFVVVYADSPEDAMLKLRDAGLEPVKAEPFDAHPRRSKRAAPAR